MFSLEAFVDDLTERYSHGMRQRTVFAVGPGPRAEAADRRRADGRPRPAQRAQLKDLLREQADRGTTVFLSTHSLDVVQELADRIGIVDHGRLIGCGTLETLRKQAALDGSLEDVFLKTDRAGRRPRGGLSRADPRLEQDFRRSVPRLPPRAYSSNSSWP